MNRWTLESGYTVVELMVVLAVSGAILISTMLVLNGKQGRTQFQQALNDLSSSLSQIMNNVSSGYFPNPGSVKCETNGGTQKIHFDNSNTAPQGTSINCIFIGKIIQFKGDNMLIYTMVGRRLRPNTTTLVTKITDADPVIVHPDVVSGGRGSPQDITESYTNQWGTKVTSVIDTTFKTPVSNGLGIFNSFGQVDTLTDSITSGSKGITAAMVAITDVSSGLQVQNALQDIGDGVVPFAFPPGGITLCLTDDGNNYGRIQLGNNNNNINQTVIIDQPKVSWTNAGCF